MHHNPDESDTGFDVDMENKSKPFGIGGYKGRIIFLGDGTEVLTDSDDTEMFDNSEEDKDLASQVSKNSSVDGDADSKLPPRAPSPPPRTPKKQEDKAQTKTNESKTPTSTTTETTAEALKEEPKEAKAEAAAVASKD